MTIRDALRPGDMGAIVGLHGSAYVPYGVDASFEAAIATGVGEAVLRGWPAAHEGVWLADDRERPGALHGALALTDEGGGTGRLRWFVVSPAARGRGLGRRLLDACLERAEGFDRLELETFSDLTTAAAMYRAAGFERVAATTGPRWGREMTFERYERVGR